MRRTMKEHSEEEKALMFDNLIDELLNVYEAPTLEKGFHSKAEKAGYMMLTALNNSGFITSEGILGK